MNSQELVTLLRKAVTQFVKSEGKYALTTVSERSLCARLARILENLANDSGLNGYYADVENNRKQQGEVKTIIDDKEKVVCVTCDLILHSRGGIAARDNLLAIEMKKHDRPSAEKKKDRLRLRALTTPIKKDEETYVWAWKGGPAPEHVCGYELGAYIELDLVNRKTMTIEYFMQGEPTGRKETFSLLQSNAQPIPN